MISGVIHRIEEEKKKGDSGKYLNVTVPSSEDDA